MLTLNEKIYQVNVMALKRTRNDLYIGQGLMVLSIAGVFIFGAFSFFPKFCGWNLFLTSVWIFNFFLNKKSLSKIMRIRTCYKDEMKKLEFENLMICPVCRNDKKFKRKCVFCDGLGFTERKLEKQESEKGEDK